MAKGFDCSTPLTQAALDNLSGHPFDFVCRYLAPAAWKSFKALTVSEAKLITANRKKIVSTWETIAGAAAQGASAGKDAGIFALQAAREVKQPEGTKIYFTVDFEASESQYETIAEYFIAADAEIPGYEIDGYGNDKIIKYLKIRGIIRKGWQTIAWSEGRIADDISIRQYDCGPNGQGLIVNGVLLDLDESFGGEGWWDTDMLKPTLDPGVATTIINTWISPAWHNTTDQQQKDYLHWLANQLRESSGQPVQG